MCGVPITVAAANPISAIARALQGTWQPEHLFTLRQSLALYDYYHEQIQACDQVIEAHLKQMALPEVPSLEPTRRVRRRRDNEVTFDARQRLHHVTGVDLIWFLVAGYTYS